MNLAALTGHKFPSQRVSYGIKDTMLYALTVGAGADPLDADDLKLVYEQDLRALPTMSAVIAYPGLWITEPQFAANYLKLLHGEQNLTISKPLPATAEVIGDYRVEAVVDKGADKGSLVYFAKEIRDAGTGELYCTASSTLFLRGDGGCGNYGTAPAPLPSEAAEGENFRDQYQTPANAALFYRLNGDMNPIHADPVAAGKAGFSRPILHGLCTYGVVGYLLTRSVCGHDPSRIRSLGVRFSSPVYPGETIRIDGTRTAQGAHFRAIAVERNQVVMTNGYARIV
jgi:acyl dehydratase